MAANEMQFMSLTGAALSKPENDSRPRTNISGQTTVFFGRGSDESRRSKPQSDKQQHIADSETKISREKSWLSHRAAASRDDSLLSQRADGPKPKSWLSDRDHAATHKNWLPFPKRSSAPRRSHKPQTPTKPKGTVLNLVPPAATINMTLLEEEMATSPNEEILSAVSGSPVSPGPPLTSLWNATNLSLTQRTKSIVRRERNARIGTWVNGVIELDEEYLDRQLGEEGPALLAQAGFASSTLVTERPAKPLLTVVIPGKDLGLVNWNTPEVCQPAPKRCVSVTPPGVESKYHLSPSSNDLLSHIVSPLEKVSATARPFTPPERPRALLQLEKLENHVDAELQHELSSPSTFGEGGSSRYSHNSSRTSIEVVHEDDNIEGAFKAPKIPLSQYLNKPLPPIPPPNRPPPMPPSPPRYPLQLQPKGDQQRFSSSRSTPNLKRNTASPRPVRSRTSRSLNEVDGVNVDLPKPTPANPDECITLQEAEAALDDQLSQLFGASGSTLFRMIDEKAQSAPQATDSSSHQSSAYRDSVLSVLEPTQLQRIPTLPRRSRRREWCMTRAATQNPISGAISALTRKRSEGDVSRRTCMQGTIPAALRRCNSFTQISASTNDGDISDTSARSCVPDIIIDDGTIVVEATNNMHHAENQQVRAAAQGVLLNILQVLPTWGDLQNTAQINKGMYRVYKDNEMHLTRNVLKNYSPAAWELREWLPSIQQDHVGTSPTSSQIEYTPQSYIDCYRRDLELINAIKMLIMEHCSSIVRAETATGLSGNSQRFEDAIWRIWSFCRIFGCGKGREDDVTGQLDWLKGGILANNQDVTATANINFDFDDIGSILLNPPEHFAKGNGNGLSADQLYDMIEIWTCLMTILQGYHGRNAQAAEYGIFDNCNFEADHTGDQLFEEWTAHIMTLGPVAIFELAEYAYDESGFGFALAKENGWTNWSLTQQGTSRTTFLKEPLSRLYEERVATAKKNSNDPRRQELKEISRKRVANMAAEIKIARRASSFKRRPVIDMSNERPCSTVTNQISVASMRLPPSPCTPTLIKSSSTSLPHSRSTDLLSPVSALSRSASTATYLHDPQTPTSSPTRQQAQPLGVVDEGDEEFDPHALQHFTPGIAEETSAMAVKRIVGMGFTPAEAREALMVTDVGTGLRIDQAVELLLRRGG